MKQNVKWSKYAWVITVLVTIALVATLVITRNTAWRFYTNLGVTSIVFISMWIWSPTSISIDDKFITIHKRIGRKRIPINSVTRIFIIEPEIERGFRFCGSGGFAGYYGWFHDSRIGRYFGYYGNRHESFLVQLKSDMQYILGCENASEMRVDKATLCTTLWGNKSNAEESLYTLVRRTKTALSVANIEIICNRGDSYELRISG